MRSLARTRLQLCGHLVVELDGRRVEDSLPSRQGRLLFAYLALNRDRPVRRDELIDCIWPERPPADASSALNTLISRLRRALGAGAIAGKGELSLVLPADAEIDVVIASESLARAQAAAADGDWQATWGPAHAALAIARRGLLPGLEAPWIEHWRRTVEELELNALELVAETGLGLGGAELAAAERGASELVERAPFRESGLGLRMRVLAARGNVAEALQAYERLRRLLRDELGTSPSAALAALHRELLEGSVPERVRRPDAQSGMRMVSEAAAAAALVGRKRELQLLESALSEAASGRRRVVLIGGEPGIGKTRLAQEAADRATGAQWEVVWARCTEGYGAPAFWPWLECIRRIAATRSPERLRRALGAGAAEVAQIVPELRELFPDVEPLQVGDVETARFRLFDAVDRFLARLAAVTPLVLALDDLQWADAPSLQLLEHLARRPHGAPILILGTYRDAEVDGAEPFAELLAALANQHGVQRVALAGLGEESVRELVSGAADASDAVVAAVHRRSGGNPFFVTQLVRQLDGIDDADDATVEAILGHEVPGGVRDVIRQRMARLPPQTGDLLTVAAILGEEFELGPLADVLELGDERVLELVETAASHRFVGESPDAVGRYRFTHALIRETLYGQLGAMRRARLHLRVADALERLHAEDANHLAGIADHLYKAAPAGAVDRAYAYALRAAEQTTARLGFEQAEEHLRRASELFERTEAGPERAARELDLQLRLGGLLMMTRGYADPEVGAACARATELCRAREVGNEQQRAGSLWRLGVYYEVRGDFATSRQIGAQLLELGSRSDASPAFELGGRQLISVAALSSGDPELACAQLAEVRRLAGALGDQPAEIFGMDFRVTSASFLGWSTSLLGSTDDGGRFAAESVALARQLGRSHDEAFALFVDALCAVLRRDAGAAGRSAEEGGALCAERGFRLFGAMTAMIAGWAAAESGDPGAGLTRIRDGLAAFKATGAGMMLHFFLGLLGEAQLRAGLLEEAGATVEQGLRALATSGCFYEPELRRLQGELASAR